MPPTVRFTIPRHPLDHCLSVCCPPVPSCPMSFMSMTHHELVGWGNRMGHVACRCRATVVGPMLLACVVPIVVVLALSPVPSGSVDGFFHKVHRPWMLVHQRRVVGLSRVE